MTAGGVITNGVMNNPGSWSYPQGTTSPPEGGGYIVEPLYIWGNNQNTSVALLAFGDNSPDQCLTSHPGTSYSTSQFISEGRDIVTTGGYTDYLTGPDTAIVTFDANGYTPVTTAMDMTALRCCEVTLSHGFRYFKELNMADLSVNTSATIPGFATTTSYANAYGFGNFATAQGNSFTTIQPPQTIGFHKPFFRVTIQMLQKPVPGALDAAFLQSNLKQHLGIKK